METTTLNPKPYYYIIIDFLQPAFLPGKIDVRNALAPLQMLQKLGFIWKHLVQAWQKEIKKRQECCTLDIALYNPYYNNPDYNIVVVSILFSIIPV